MGKKKKKLDKVKVLGTQIFEYMRRGEDISALAMEILIPSSVIMRMIEEDEHLNMMYSIGVDASKTYYRRKLAIYMDKGSINADAMKLFYSHYLGIMELKPVEKIEITENTAEKRGTPTWILDTLSND